MNPPAKKTEEIKVEKYSIPPAKNGATLVFIIDDGGYDTYNLKLYTSLPFPIAIAVLPKLAHSKDCAAIVRNSGQELMLHQPMQAQNLKLNPGAGAILPDMSLSEVYKQVSENIAEIGPIKGLNNHEGSLITCDVMKIGAVLDAVLDNGIFFVDSRTSAQTKAPQAALERDMKILERDVFIDDIISKDEMLAQIYRGLGIANKNGKVIMIGHVDKSAKILPQLLNDMYPYLKAKKGYKIAFPSQIQK
ncbi:MAG: divergent polysaccharide deacetylase family protein [Treponema succinifaciens]|nr:MAG: divergent polysaccharide deacetylase family protein [Treponema succinifaciens]